MKYKNFLSFLILFTVFCSCKKYDCECISTYNNPPKGNISTSSNQKIKAISKSKAKQNCAKYEDDITECQLK